MQAIPLRQSTYGRAVARRVNVDELVGAPEIADRLGLQLGQTVHDWRRRHADFPEPVTKLRQAMVWVWPDVEAWAKATNRLPS